MFSFFIMYFLTYLIIIPQTFDLSHNLPFFQELAEKEQWTHQEYPAVLIKETEIKNIVKVIDNPLHLKSTVSYFVF